MQALARRSSSLGAAIHDGMVTLITKKKDSPSAMVGSNLTVSLLSGVASRSIAFRMDGWTKHYSVANRLRVSHPLA
jgi:hypothetical protein